MEWGMGKGGEGEGEGEKVKVKDVIFEIRFKYMIAVY